MSKVLHRLLTMLEWNLDDLYSYHNVSYEWPKGELERMLQVGLLRQIESTDSVECMQCWNLEEVVFIDNPTTGKTTVYVKCFQCGSNRVPEEWIHQWQSNVVDLIRIVGQQFGFSGPSELIVPDQVWRLGKTKLAGASRFVYFARGLDCREGWRIVQDAQFAERSLILVPATPPGADLRIERLPLTIPLTTVLAWQGDQLAIDHEHIEESFAASSERLKSERKNNQTSARRSQRLALIEQLVGEMKDHLRSAREYAFSTLERTGTPELLLRPQQDFLARKLGVNKSSVSRAINDPEAMQLKFLWELAEDVDRIMNFAGNAS